MEQNEMVAALEALIFACGEPVTYRELKKVFSRHLKELPDEEKEASLNRLRPCLKELRKRWPQEGEEARGFALIEVADGYTFRSVSRYSDLIRALREQRPVRLSKPALETLSIVAYRQPVTKSEIDFVRGVDCGGTLRILLERGLLKIVGKKEEPGRPLLYGTTRDFLSFFNLSNLKELPSLREYQELNEDSVEKISLFDEELSAVVAVAKQKLEGVDEEGVGLLVEAMDNLASTEIQARDALAQEGIVLDPDDA